jgi:hypothetical protein
MELIKVDWKPADSAYGRGQQAYIEFGQALAKLVAGGVTQEVIASRYDMSQPSVASAIAVGADKRIIGATNKLPRSTHALYLLTTLDDAGFKELAKPETTQAKIQEYKRRLAPPPEPTVEPPRKPVVPPRVGGATPTPPQDSQDRGRPLTQEEWEETLQREKERERPPSVKSSYEKDLRWAFATMGIEGTPRIAVESLDAIYRTLSQKRHPDKSGGSQHAMSDLNLARTLIVEKSLWVR